MKLNKIAHCIALMEVAGNAFGQAAPEQKLQRVEITGSSIKRIASEGALPVQVLNTEDLKAQGITTAEQVISFLNVNGNGIDNLARNSDVAAGSGRGSNGFSAANLRGQGASNTLVLLTPRHRAVASRLSMASTHWMYPAELVATRLTAWGRRMKCCGPIPLPNMAVPGTRAALRFCSNP